MEMTDLTNSNWIVLSSDKISFTGQKNQDRYCKSSKLLYNSILFVIVINDDYDNYVCCFIIFSIRQEK